MQGISETLFALKLGVGELAGDVKHDNGHTTTRTAHTAQEKMTKTERSLLESDNAANCATVTKLKTKGW